MSVAVYGKAFDRTKENEALHRFIDALNERWGDSRERIVILANVSWNDRAVDIAVLKHDAIVIIDLKDYGGTITLSENGPWYAAKDGARVEVKGGGGNPFIQVRRYKDSIIAWFKEHGTRLPSGNLSNPHHVQGLIIFQQACVLDEQRDLPQRVRSWFRVCTFNDCVRRLAEAASPQINLSDRDIDAIVSHLGAPPYSHPGSLRLAPVIDDDTMADIPQSLHEALAASETFLKSGDRILLVSGMIGTGLERLVSMVISRMASQGLPFSVHARNARVAARYGDQDAHSIYTSIYARSPREKDDVLVYDALPNGDDPDRVYVLVEGHFLSDSLTTLGLRRYGTGNLLRDYLAFIDLQHSNRRLLIFGDPFQLSAGGGNDSIMRKALLEGVCGIPVIEVFLPMLLTSDHHDPFVSMAEVPAQAIAEGIYNSLNLPCDAAYCEITTEGTENDLERLFKEHPRSAKYVAYKNEDVSRVNAFVRRRVFSRGEEIEPGDIIHVRMGPPSGDDLQRQIIPHQSFAEVISVNREMRPIVQPLSGRSDPITVSFLELTARSLPAGGQATFICLRDFLYGAKAQDLNGDEVLALRANAADRWKQRLSELQPQPQGEMLKRAKIEFLERDPYLNAARVRFGYALTIFEAQGHRFRTIVANLDKTGSAMPRDCTNESYYRLVYTLLTLPTDRILLSNVPALTPFIEAYWSATHRTIIEPNFDVVTAAGLLPLKAPTSAQQALRRALIDSLAECGVRVLGAKVSQHEEQYYLARGDDGMVLSANYREAGFFTRLRSLKATSPEIVDSVRAALPSP